MQTRRALALIVTWLGAAQLACTGSVGEQLSDPPVRPLAPAGGAGGAGPSDNGVVTAAPSPTTTTIPDPGETGPIAAGGSTGSASDPLDLPALPPIEFCDAPTKVLMASCGNGSCHSNPRATIGDFGINATRAYDFVDRVSARHPDCGLIIDSQNYSKSLLLTKVTGDFESPRCGERMPVGSFTITDEQIDCLSSWLQQFQM